MRRRDFMGILGGLVAAPLVAYAQDAAQPEQTPQPAPPQQTPEAPPESPPETPLPTPRQPRIGVLMEAPRRDKESEALLKVFSDRLSSLGWPDGEKVQTDVRWAAGSERRLRSLAAELVATTPDLLLATGRAPLRELAAAGKLPLLFVNVADPLGTGLISSLEKPAGNITGIGLPEFGPATQLVETLKRVAPDVMRIAVVGDADDPPPRGQVAAIQAVASAFDVEVAAIEADSPRDLARAVAGFSRTPAGGLIVLAGDLSRRERSRMVELAARYKLPAIYPDSAYVDAGGLVSCGPDLREHYRLAADYAARILQGEKPGDLPVQVTAKSWIVVNARTAKKLGLAISPALRSAAGQVVE